MNAVAEQTRLIDQAAALEVCGGDEALLRGIVAAGLCERSKVNGAILYNRCDLERVLSDELDLRHARRLAPTARPLPTQPTAGGEAPKLERDEDVFIRCPGARAVPLNAVVPATLAARLSRAQALTGHAYVRDQLVSVIEAGADAILAKHGEPIRTEPEAEMLQAEARAQAGRAAAEAERDQLERDSHEQREQRRERLAKVKAEHPDQHMRNRLWGAFGPGMACRHYCPVCGAEAHESPWRQPAPGMDAAGFNRLGNIARLRCSECEHVFSARVSDCTPADVAPTMLAAPYSADRDPGEMLPIGTAAKSVGLPLHMLEVAVKNRSLPASKIKSELFITEHDLKHWVETTNPRDPGTARPTPVDPLPTMRGKVSRRGA